MPPLNQELRQPHPWVLEGARRVRFAAVGIFLPDINDVVSFARRCESLGFDAYWANDHPNRSMDCWSLLTALAMTTERLRLISLVSCVYYRSPFLLARMAADVDRASDGRLVLGLGIGDDVPEFGQMGLAFPPAKERHEAMEETFDIVEGLWRREPFTYNGKHFHVSSATMSPLPVQRPYVPVLIGGGGERITLRQVARRADVSNFAPHEWAGGAYDGNDVKRKYAALRQHCESQGRPYESILRSHMTPLVTLAPTGKELERKRAGARIPDRSLRSVPLFATTAQAISHFQALADLGVQYFLTAVNGHDAETLELLASEVMPAIKLGRT